MAEPDTELVLICPVDRMRHNFRGMNSAVSNQRMYQLLLEQLLEWAAQLEPDENPVDAAALASTIALALSDYLGSLVPIEKQAFRILMPALVDEILESMCEFDPQALVVARYLAEMLEGTWIRTRTTPPAS